MPTLPQDTISSPLRYWLRAVGIVRVAGDMERSRYRGERVRSAEVSRLFPLGQMTRNRDSFHLCWGPEAGGWAGQVAQASMKRERNMISLPLDNCLVGRKQAWFWYGSRREEGVGRRDSPVVKDDGEGE
jgi:hypothetical protein